MLCGLPPKGKRRSRSKSRSAKAQVSEDKKETEEEWQMFTNKVPWVTSTPATRHASKKADTPLTVTGRDTSSSQQSPLIPSTHMAEEHKLEPLTDEEVKTLSHLRGLRDMKIALTGELGLQLEMLEAKERDSMSSKALSHGHLNRLNKLKSQLTAQAKKISNLDQEWSNFVQTTMKKIAMHSDLYQQCRADLMEQYNQRLEELRRLRAELSQASQSLLDQQPGEPQILETVGIAAQMEIMQTALSQAGQVTPMVDLVEDDEEDLEMQDSQEVQFVPGTKKPNRTTFKGASSPQKVAQLHLKGKKDKEKIKEVKEVKEAS